jgi:hypothetical protein
MKIQNILKSVVFILIFSNICNAQYNYPTTKSADSSHTYFGATYKDPYQWLESYYRTAGFICCGNLQCRMCECHASGIFT